MQPNDPSNERENTWEDMLSQLQNIKRGNAKELQNVGYSLKNEAEQQEKQEEQSYENKKHTEDIADRQQNRIERKKYAKSVYRLIIGWLIGIFVLILLAGTGTTFGSAFFHLSDTVLLAMIGGTTVNVLGLFVIVMRHLFPNNSKE